MVQCTFCGRALKEEHEQCQCQGAVMNRLKTEVKNLEARMHEAQIESDERWEELIKVEDQKKSLEVNIDQAVEMLDKVEFDHDRNTVMHAVSSVLAGLKGLQKRWSEDQQDG